jgi:hypothetical protein
MCHLQRYKQSERDKRIFKKFHTFKEKKSKNWGAFLILRALSSIKFTKKEGIFQKCDTNYKKRPQDTHRNTPQDTARIM